MKPIIANYPELSKQCGHDEKELGSLFDEIFKFNWDQLFLDSEINFTQFKVNGNIYKFNILSKIGSCILIKSIPHE